MIEFLEAELAKIDIDISNIVWIDLRHLLNTSSLFFLSN